MPSAYPPCRPNVERTEICVSQFLATMLHGARRTRWGIAMVSESNTALSSLYSDDRLFFQALMLREVFNSRVSHRMQAMLEQLREHRPRPQPRSSWPTGSG